MRKNGLLGITTTVIGVVTKLESLISALFVRALANAAHDRAAN